jgi:hypothetical protein
MTQAVELSYLDYLTTLEESRQKAVALARRYHEGDQEVYLTERAAEFLGLHGSANKFRLNTCQTVVGAILEKLLVAGFGTNEAEGESATPTQRSWAWDLWQANRMDALAADVHEWTLRDGEAFVIVDWDAVNGMPRLIPHPRFVDAGNGGDGYGVRMVYPDENASLPPLFACKQWTETIVGGNGLRTSRMRRTLYFPERIERYYYSGGWKPYEDPDQPWTAPWVTQDGKPLGIAAIHFKNRNLRCEAWDAIPLQDGINKSLIDLLATADQSAFRIFFAAGWIPTTDGKPPKADGTNLLPITPGSLLGTPNAEGKLTAIEPANLDQLAGLVQKLIMWTAGATSTPLARFQITGQVASADTMKEGDQPLDAKIEQRQSLFGNAWEDVLGLARRLANTFGDANRDEAVEFSTNWFRTANLDDLEQKRKLGVPQEMIWSEMGYSPEQIEAMKATDEYQARQAMSQAALDLKGGGA